MLEAPRAYYWRRLAMGILLSLLSAVLLFLAMPPYGIWPLALIGFIPMILAQHRVLPPSLSSLATAIAVGGFIGGFFLYVFWTFLRSYPYFWLFPVIIGGICFLTDRAVRDLHVRTSYRWFIPHGALVWVAIEMIRNLIPAIGTCGFIGYSYFRVPWLVQPVGLVGMLGLDLLSMAVAYALGLTSLTWFDRLASSRGWHFPDTQPVPAPVTKQWSRWVGVSAVLWVFVSLIMAFAPVSTPYVSVAAVQPKTGGDFAILQRLTREAAAQGAKIIVWPEGVLAYDPREKNTEQFKSLAVETDAYIVIGHGLRLPQGLRNEASVISPKGEFLGTYGKDHPVTYLGETSLTRGNYPSYQTPYGGLGSIICYDLDFSDSARKIVRNGAQLLAVPSNDWPVLTGIQPAIVQFRAMENRVAMVKADTQYDSLVVDAKGRLVSTRISSQGTQALLIADVQMGTGQTIYTRYGDWVGWLALLGMVFFAVPNPLLKPAINGSPREQTQDPHSI